MLPCFSPAAYVCVGRRVLIHKQLHLLQAGLAGCTGDFWPELHLQRGRCGCCGKLCCYLLPNLVGQQPTDPAGGSHPCQTHGHRKPCSSQAPCIFRLTLDPLGCQRSRAGVTPWWSTCNEPCPSLGQSIGAGNRGSCAKTHHQVQLGRTWQDHLPGACWLGSMPVSQLRPSSEHPIMKLSRFSSLYNVHLNF